MNFLERATPLIKRGIPVIPIPPCEKGPKLANWPAAATTDTKQIALWHSENSDYNVGCVARLDGFWMLDCDRRDLDDLIEKETGQKMPETMVVQSRKGLHFYFLQNDASRAMGNRNREGMFDAQVDRKQVVGPGSIHPSGAKYKMVSAEPIVPAPDWLIDWIKANSQSAKPKVAASHPVLHQDFDPDDFFKYYEKLGAFTIEGHRDYNGADVCITDTCIIAGRKHTGSWCTGFLVSDNAFGYKCMSPDCEDAGIGAVLRKLNEDYPRYEWPIWEEEEEQPLPKWAEDIVDENPVLDADDDDILYRTPSKRAEVAVEPPVILQFEELEKLLEPTLSAEGVPESEPVVAPVVKKHRLSEMPEECMYGWLGEKAKELDMPLGFAYPSIMTVFASQIASTNAGTRPTLYTALIGPVHSGKSVAMARACQSLILTDFDTIKKATPGSDRGLINIFGGKKKKDNGKIEDTAMLDTTPKVRLMLQDELRNMFAKISIQGSSLASTLCSLWYEDEAGSADKTGEHVAFVRLNILGGLKANDKEEFADCFGKETTAGLYDRFIYGLAPKGWEWTEWTAIPERRHPMGVRKISDPAYSLWRQWKTTAKTEALAKGSMELGRLEEIAVRVAIITAAANHESVVGEDCMRAALEFCDWQYAIRESYQPSVSEGPDAKCTETIINALGKCEGKWVKWTLLAQNRNWYKKFGVSLLQRTRDSLVKAGLMLEESETEEEADGKVVKHPKKTGKVMFVPKEYL